MSRFRKLSQTIWHCQYHIVWVPKYRYRILSGEVAREVENLIRAFSHQMKCEINRAECANRSCSFAGNDTTKALNFKLYGSDKRENSDTDTQPIQKVETKTLLGKQFLGKKV